MQPWVLTQVCRIYIAHCVAWVATRLNRKVSTLVQNRSLEWPAHPKYPLAVLLAVSSAWLCMRLVRLKMQPNDSSSRWAKLPAFAVQQPSENARVLGSAGLFSHSQSSLCWSWRARNGARLSK